MHLPEAISEGFGEMVQEHGGAFRVESRPSEAWTGHSIVPDHVESELHAQGAKELLDGGPGGFEVLHGMDIESDVEGILGSAGDIGKGLFECTDQGGKRGHDFGCGVQSLVGSDEPLQRVFGGDFDSLFQTDKNVCHGNVFTFCRAGQTCPATGVEMTARCGRAVVAAYRLEAVEAHEGGTEQAALRTQVAGAQKIPLIVWVVFRLEEAGDIFCKRGDGASGRGMNGLWTTETVGVLTAR